MFANQHDGRQNWQKVISPPRKLWCIIATINTNFTNSQQILPRLAIFTKVVELCNFSADLTNLLSSLPRFTNLCLQDDMSNTKASIHSFSFAHFFLFKSRGSQVPMARSQVHHRDTNEQQLWLIPMMSSRSIKLKLKMSKCSLLCWTILIPNSILVVSPLCQWGVVRFMTGEAYSSGGRCSHKNPKQKLIFSIQHF